MREKPEEAAEPLRSTVDCRQDEQFERHHGRDRISGQTEDEFSSACCKYGGTPGTNRYACKMEFRAKFGEHLLDQIVFPHRHAAGENQDFRFEAAFDGRSQRLFFVGRVSELNGLRAGGARQNFDGNSVAVPHLERSGLGARIDDFIACGKNREAGRGKHFEACGAGLRRKSYLRIAQAGPRATSSVPACASLPRGTICSPLCAARSRNRLAFALGVLDHHDRIRASRNGRARHDFNALSGDRRIEGAAGAEFADAFEAGARRSASAARTAKPSREERSKGG